MFKTFTTNCYDKNVYDIFDGYEKKLTNSISANFLSIYYFFKLIFDFVIGPVVAGVVGKTMPRFVGFVLT